MLPLQLLRIKIFNKGKNISPIFCRPDGDSCEFKLAAEIIKQFEEACSKRETKGLLEERISMLEASYDDYKLVRALYVILERRCTFKSLAEQNPADGIADISAVDPFHLRKYLFEESSRRGYALTDYKRKEVFDSISSKTKLPSDMASRMWADLEENMVLDEFRTMEPECLIAWYNLSSMQTLLFKCTKLEFNMEGGSNWKRALRTVKRLGLMYKLDYRRTGEPQNETSNQKLNPNSCPKDRRALEHTYYEDYNNILCSIDGPVSIFKQTDRYGTSISKFLPAIITARNWSLRALIVRKTPTMGKKISEFRISNAESPSLPSKSDLFSRSNNSFKETILERGSPSLSSSDALFDSNIEQKFASKFEQFSNGWKLIREPDPIILSNGRGFIPDFAFQKYGIRVYLEIVGFWTNDYLVKKIEKIADIILLSTPSSASLNPTPLARFDRKNFFIAVNMESYVSGAGSDSDKVLASLKLSDYIEKNQLIKYKNDNVPLRPILDHLRSIDLEMVKKLAIKNKTPLVEELTRILDQSVSSSQHYIISLEEIAEKYDIPVESVLQIVNSGDIISSYKDRYLTEDNYLIPIAKVRELKPLLGNEIRYIDACRILADHHIPETCYSSVLHKIGYNMSWRSMDIRDATIKLHD